MDLIPCEGSEIPVCPSMRSDLSRDMISQIPSLWERRTIHLVSLVKRISDPIHALRRVDTPVYDNMYGISA